MKRLLATLFVCLLLAPASGRAGSATQSASTPKDAASTPEAKIAELFGATPGAFVLYDRNADRFVRHNAARCAVRASPFSTFKVPNSLVGLESGVIKDADFVIPWDKKKYPADEAFLPEWNRDHDLRSAIQYSVVWYYRELALRVGKAPMNRYVEAMNYGNRDTSGPLDGFWLNSSIKISPDEQIAFLRALYDEKLPFSKRSMKIVKDILPSEKIGAATIRGKTGTGRIDGELWLGWYVGWVETGDNVVFFALQMDSPDVQTLMPLRKTTTKKILSALGYLPGAAAS
nr:ClassD_beta_lactamase [uncultured bacterium]